MKNFQLATIEEALEDLREGRMVILVDDESRENEGDIIFPAEKITPEIVNFMIKHARGIVCLALTEEYTERLALPMMVKRNVSPTLAQFTVSIEAASGVTTGVSAKDRAHTIRVAINEKSTSEDITTPGHVFPLQAREGGVLARAGHTEGSTDLMRLAGLKSAAAICEILNDDGSMARLHDLIPFATQHNIKIVSIEDLIVYRIKNESIVDEIAVANLPTRENGNFRVYTFQGHIDKAHHMAMVKGELNPEEPVLVRLHSECLTGDTFGSSRCDCGLQLKYAMSKLAQEGGVLLYLRQEGRGIGLGNKIRAYALQDAGIDTVEANHRLGFGADERDYGIGAQILKLLGLSKIRLMTNNPNKVTGITRYGIEVVSREPLEIVPNPHNIAYLRTKRDKMGHLFTFENDIVEKI
ncbi:MAG: bifunctional 3,4-dihydroxy-2-butanone-4-phosphate synthase/GTP cyclohydrolase II [Gammaproteobacteria bacterium]|nr:bifunctional 3,4-dihydroxy-2-butanone-4-phosphate synthase/GTP cyclohydrolase II [Gammaproteobacteria bacterium]